LLGFRIELGCGDTQPSQIAIRSSGLSSHLMLVADGIQLGSRKISPRDQTPFRQFTAFRAIEITTEFFLVGMATNAITERSPALRTQGS
jgi:hypothetical protein